MVLTNLCCTLQGVLVSSLPPLPPSSSSYSSPAFSALEARYGRLFAEEIEQRWNDGGRGVWEVVVPGEERVAEEAEGGGKEEEASGEEEEEEDAEGQEDDEEEDGDVSMGPE